MTYNPGQENDALFNAVKETLTGESPQGRFARNVLGEEVQLGHRGLDEAAKRGKEQDPYQSLDTIQKYVGLLRKVLKNAESIDGGKALVTAAGLALYSIRYAMDGVYQAALNSSRAKNQKSMASHWAQKLHKMSEDIWKARNG